MIPLIVCSVVITFLIGQHNMYIQIGQSTDV